MSNSPVLSKPVARVKGEYLNAWEAHLNELYLPAFDARLSVAEYDAYVAAIALLRSVIVKAAAANFGGAA